MTQSLNVLKKSALTDRSFKIIFHRFSLLEMDETESVYIKLFCSNKLRVALFDFWKSRWLTHRVWASFSSSITCRLTNLNRPLQAASGQKPGDPNSKSKVHQLVILLFQMYILRNRFGLVKWSFIWDAHLDSDFNFRLPGTYQVLNTDFIISPSASFLLIFQDTPVR